MSATNTGATSGGTGASGTSGGGTPTAGSTSGSADIVIDPKPFTPDTAWPADLVLDRLKSNWEEWNRRLNLIVDQRQFSYYLDGSFPCPDPTTYPTAAFNWKCNDRALRAFILEHVSNVDYNMASKFTVAHEVYDTLRKKHEKMGIHAQIHIMKEALGVRFSLAAPVNLSRTLDEIDRLHDRFTKMGKMDDDKWKIIIIINALDQLPQFQFIINELFETSPTITSTDVKNWVLREEEFLRREGLGLDLTPGSADTLALSENRPRSGCAHCKRATHRTKFCIAPGGKMAGKSIDEARAAQRAAATKTRSRGSRNTTPQSANTAQNSNNPPAPLTTAGPGKNNNTITFNGKCYMLVSEDNAPTMQASKNDCTAFSAISMADYDQEEYFAMLATTGDVHASANWDANTRPVDLH